VIAIARQKNPGSGRVGFFQHDDGPDGRPTGFRPGAPAGNLGPSPGRREEPETITTGARFASIFAIDVAWPRLFFRRMDASEQVVALSARPAPFRRGPPGRLFAVAHPPAPRGHAGKEVLYAHTRGDRRAFSPTS
jgi:hypothetical protein